MTDLIFYHSLKIFPFSPLCHYTLPPSTATTTERRHLLHYLLEETRKIQGCDVLFGVVLIRESPQPPKAAAAPSPHDNIITVAPSHHPSLTRSFWYENHKLVLLLLLLLFTKTIGIQIVVTNSWIKMGLKTFC